MKTKEEFISKVYDLIKDPSSFTSSWLARDKNGKSVAWDDPDAAQFDLVGAVEKIGVTDQKLKEEVFSEMRSKVPIEYSPLYKFSERGGHQQVMAFLNTLLNRGDNTGHYVCSDCHRQKDEAVHSECPCPATDLKPCNWQAQADRRCRNMELDLNRVQAEPLKLEVVESAPIVTVTTAPKKRGRPKGSKNRSKP